MQAQAGMLFVWTRGLHANADSEMGNSLGVWIPRGLAEQIGLAAGAEVSMSAKDGELVVKPALPKRLGLDDLLAGVTAGNLHSSVDAGEAVGLEIF